MDFLESAAVLIPVLTGMALTVYRGEPDTLGQFEAQYCFSAQLQNIYTAQGLGAFCQKGAEDRIFDLEEPMGTRLAAFKAGGQWLLLGPYVETGWSVQAARLLLAGQGASESALPMYKAYRCKLPIVMQELAVRTAFVLAENLGGGARAGLYGDQSEQVHDHGGDRPSLGGEKEEFCEPVLPGDWHDGESVSGSDALRHCRPAAG